MIREYREHFRKLSESMAGKPVNNAFPSFLAEIVKVLEDIDKRLDKIETHQTPKGKEAPKKGWGSGGFGK